MFRLLLVASRERRNGNDMEASTGFRVEVGS